MMFDFVGQDDIASEIFVVQDPTSSKSIESSSTGSIMDHGIQASSTLYVLWFSNQDVQVNVCFIQFSLSTENGMCFGFCRLIALYCACLFSGKSLISTK